MRRKILTERQWLFEWDRLFDVAEGVGFSVWGVSTLSAPRAWYPWRPFIWHTYVTASCMGMFNNGLRFDETFQVKEDYELCLRCIRDEGGVVGARYLYWENDHWTRAGGCREYRTGEMEQECIKRLVKMYPGMIRRVTRGGSEWSIDLQF